MVFMTTSTESRALAPGNTPRLGDLAGAAAADRNRAVDAYRAGAMIAVALGHWAAVAVGTDANGELWAGNALEYAPGMAWLTWLFQVMPLFFVVGGFASAMSLDSHIAQGRRTCDWVAQRLRRMMAPAVVLAAVWTGVIGLGVVAGQASLVIAAAFAAAIPLWFLANYTIDTALAPHVLLRFRRHPVGVPALLVGAFVAIELIRLAGVPVLPQLNWVLGWLIFQVLGFAWRDGLLPSGRAVCALSIGFLGAAVTAVAVGPWPVAMVHFPGLAHSPTQPPTIALLLFGFGYSGLAIAAAPRVTAALAGDGRGSKAAWRAAVAANAIAMSVYLWHMTAAVVGSVVLWSLGLLPTASVGSPLWWFQKIPVFIVSFLALAAIVSAVCGHERRALLSPPVRWRGGTGSVLATAALISLSVKLWAGGSLPQLSAGLVGVLAVWMVVLRGLPKAPAALISEVRS